MLGVYGAHVHFWRHMAPIVEVLRARGHEVEVWSRNGDFATGYSTAHRSLFDTVMVASWDDAQMFADKRVIYVEHGSAQSYVGVEGQGYAGAPGLEHVVLFLAPREDVAARWRARYPEAEVAVVGCPALDRHALAKDAQRWPTMPNLRFRGPGAHRPPEGGRYVEALTRGFRTPSTEEEQSSAAGAYAPVVAFTFRWRCFVCAETSPALGHYEAALPAVCEALRADGAELLGHAHPRGWAQRAKLWERLGVPYEPDPDVVLRRASLLVADSTSLMYEAAALDIPVLALNSPTYRRSVEHGLRWWSHVPGLQCDEPEDLERMVYEALADPPEAQALRARAASYVYSAVRDGQAAPRAADAIERMLNV